MRGKPRDEGDRPWVALLPRPVRKQMWRMMLMRRVASAKVRASLEQHAVPFAKPAVVNDRLADLIDSDRVIVKPGVKRFEGGHLIFSDGSRVACDVFVCATGYDLAYPFFSPEVAERNGSFVDRYLRVIPPRQPGLYFVGSLSVVGPLFPNFRTASYVGRRFAEWAMRSAFAYKSAASCCKGDESGVGDFPRCGTKRRYRGVLPLCSRSRPRTRGRAKART